MSGRYLIMDLLYVTLVGSLSSLFWGDLWDFYYGNLGFPNLFILHNFTLVDKQKIKPERKEKTSKSLSACEDNTNATELKHFHSETA